VDYEQIDVALVPGVAFDAAGHRLGRGRGYYDRFLRALGGTMGTVPSVPPKLIGLCFDFQKVPEVPVDANDIPVDMVI
jgi:5-formyltetrahydrofolate cyclo-ligase